VVSAAEIWRGLQQTVTGSNSAIALITAANAAWAGLQSSKTMMKAMPLNVLILRN